MKKFLSLLLTMSMLWSLSMPVGAVTVSGGTEKDVTATFDPGTIEFTGIQVYEDEDYNEYRYDEESKTYTILLPADEVGGNARFGFALVGNNLKYMPDDNTMLNIKHEDSSGYSFELGYEDTPIFVTEYCDGCYDWSIFSEDGDWEKISYTNDGGENWTTYTFEVKQTYTIANNTAADAHGTVTANEYAVAGEIVNLTVTPDKDYELESLTVKQGENEITVTDNKFEMPAGAVAVTATFKEAVPQKINIGTIENGSVSADLSEATVGTTVTLTVTPAEDCRLVEVTVNDGAVELTKVDDTTYTFVMPNTEVSVNATFEKIPHNVTVNTSENGTVDSDKETATKGETVTLTWTAAEGYKLGKITVADAEGNEVTVDQGLTTCTFTMPAYDVTVDATFKKIIVVSADITWGSLAYTYTIDDGWKNNSDAENAGTVTVTNTGEAAFYTKATYSAETAFMNIRGTFDHGVTQLAENESQSFKLSLHNEPEQALNGQKIGTVTVHISETEFDDFVTVTSEQELLNALIDGGAIKFGNDITVSSIDVVEATSDISIDLNGFTFGGIRFDVLENVTVSISGGTIGIRPDNLGGNLTVSDCTVTRGIYAFVTDAGTTTINNSTVYGVVYTTGGTVELGADVMLEANGGYIGLWCDRAGASIVCHFDPSESLYNEYNKHTVTNNGDGTWTVRYSK